MGTSHDGCVVRSTRGIQNERVASLSDAVGALEGRGDLIEARIAKLDVQLGKYKAQIKKMRPGPAQQGIKRRALQVCQGLPVCLPPPNLPLVHPSSPPSSPSSLAPGPQTHLRPLSPGAECGGRVKLPRGSLAGARRAQM